MKDLARASFVRRSSARLTRVAAVLAMACGGIAAPATATDAATVIPPQSGTVGPSTTAPGADTSLLWSFSGAGTQFTTKLDVVYPAGLDFAHADTIPGVPTSPIANRPHAGDTVGWVRLTGTLTSTDPGCTSSPQTVVDVPLTWQEPFAYAPLPGQVAEITAGNVPMRIVRVVGDGGVVHYESHSVPGTWPLCSNLGYRMSGYVTPSHWWETVLRTPQQPGAYTSCTTATTPSGTWETCTPFLVDATDTNLPPDGQACTITGTSGDDRIVGTAGDDVICGLGGNDRIAGRGGNDVLVGGDGSDVLSGGPGDDAIYGGAGDDAVSGGPGNDALAGGTGSDRVTGAAGDDVGNGGDGTDRVLLGIGNDTLNGGADDDILNGGPGGNVADGGNGADSCRTGAPELLGLTVNCE